MYVWWWARVVRCVSVPEDSDGMTHIGSTCVDFKKLLSLISSTGQFPSSDASDSATESTWPKIHKKLNYCRRTTHCHVFSCKHLYQQFTTCTLYIHTALISTFLWLSNTSWSLNDLEDTFRVTQGW